jgi:hypothetical protein
MSSERSAPIVDLTLGASRLLCVTVMGVGLLATASVFASGLAFWLRCLIALVIAVSGVYWLAVEGLRRISHAIVRLVLMDDDEAMVVERAGQMRSVRMIRVSVIAASLAVVTLRTGRRRTRTLCIARDAVDTDGFRRLRMRLNISPPLVRQTGLRRILRRSDSSIGGNTDI